MKTKMLLLLVGLIALGLNIAACDDDDDDTGGGDCAASDCDADGDADGDADTDTDSDADTDTDADTDADETLGSDCGCTGAACVAPATDGVPQPHRGTVTGCADVPTDVAGAKLVCYRSYNGKDATQTWFANGYCSLAASSCEPGGAAAVCNKQVGGLFGEYDTMTACPAGSVMLQFQQAVTTLVGDATLNLKVCAKGCDTAADCRTGENDPVWNEATQYTCVDKDGVKFCYDPRNLGTYTATAY